MQMMGRPVISFDPEGLIFAVGINSEIIKLYNLKSFDKGFFYFFYWFLNILINLKIINLFDLKALIKVCML